MPQPHERRRYTPQELGAALAGARVPRPPGRSGQGKLANGKPDLGGVVRPLPNDKPDPGAQGRQMAQRPERWHRPKVRG